MGLIERWARFAATMPRMANFFTQTPILRAIAKRAGRYRTAAHDPAHLQRRLLGNGLQRALRGPALQSVENV